MAVVALVLATGLPASPAAAQPSGDDASPMQRYERLGAQAASAAEDLTDAERNLDAAREAEKAAAKRLASTSAALRQAGRVAASARIEAKSVVTTSYRGARLSQLSSLLMSDGSRRDYLDRAVVIEVIATDRAETLGRASDAVSAATTARTRAQKARARAGVATRQARNAVANVRQRQERLESQIAELRSALGELSDGERDELGQVQDNGSYEGPPGAANDALQAALSKRGAQYQWGATGPDEFDCSGLTSWAYMQAGVTIPRTSREQYGAGSPVGWNELQPGDLVFFDDGSGDPGTIHHVGMYVGDGKMIDAPTEGQVVDVRSAEGDGHFIGGRRIAG